MREHGGKKFVLGTFAGDIGPADAAEIMPEGVEIVKKNGLSSAIFDMREQTSTFPVLDIYEQHTMLSTLLPPGFRVVVLICPEQREYLHMAVAFSRQAGLDYVVAEDMDEALALAVL